MSNLISIWENRLPKENTNFDNIKLLIGGVIDHYESRINAENEKNKNIHFLLTAETMLIKQLDSKLNASNYWPLNNTFKLTEDYINLNCDNEIKRLNTVLLELEQEHVENLPAIENNKKIYQGLMDMMSKFKIPTSQQVYGYENPRSRTKKYYNQHASWPSEIAASIVRNDNYGTAVTSIKSKIETIERVRKEKLAEVRKREQDRLKLEREKFDVMELARYQVKYNLDATATWYTILSKIECMDGYSDNNAELQKDYEFVESKISGY